MTAIRRFQEAANAWAAQSAGDGSVVCVEYVGSEMACGRGGYCKDFFRVEIEDSSGRASSIEIGVRTILGILTCKPEES